MWDITQHLDNKTASLPNSLDEQYWQDPYKLYLPGWQYYSGNPVQTLF